MRFAIHLPKRQYKTLLTHARNRAKLNPDARNNYPVPKMHSVKAYILWSVVTTACDRPYFFTLGVIVFTINCATMLYDAITLSTSS